MVAIPEEEEGEVKSQSTEFGFSNDFEFNMHLQTMFS